MSRHKGNQFEELALDYLQRQGLQLVARNYHATRGEIDLIMQDKKTLSFIEVRYRKADDYGSAAESVDYRKQQHLIVSAQTFLQQNRQYDDWPCRFDVLAISGTGGANIDWIKNAFELT
ncbi:MAG: YraN family protein [Chromatiales bacterium]|jgi:putative endonuclease